MHLAPRLPPSQPSFIVMNSTYEHRSPSREDAIELPEQEQLPYVDAPAWQRAQAVESSSPARSQPDHGTESTPTSNATSPTHAFDDNIETLEGCQTYTFRRGGDTLTLYVGSGENRDGLKTMVCSYDLVRHLSQEWKEVCKKSKLRGLPPRRQISLKDDNPNMMALVMKIAHGKHKGTKESLDFDDLLDVARISYRYQTNELLVFPLPVWTKPHRQRILQPGYEQWMFISYQFGFEDDYLKLARHLALNCRVNANGELLNLAGDEVLTGEFSEGALKKIKESRLEILQTFLDTLYRHVDIMTNGNTCVAKTESSTQLLNQEERTECTLLNQGSMLRHLRMIGYWPDPFRHREARELLDSVNEVVHALTNIQVIVWRRQRHDSANENSLHDHRHQACDSGKLLANKISNILINMEDPVLEDRKIELRMNAGELKLSSADGNRL